MDIQTYKFSYGGTFKKILSKFLMSFANFFIIPIILLTLLFIFSNINHYLKSYTFTADILNIIKWIEIILSSIILGFLVIQPYLPQKVEIHNNIIKVYRHCLINFHRGFNDTILIDKIAEIRIEEKQNLGNLPRIMPVAVIDWDNLVRIEMETGILLYYIPVENSNEFIAEVNKRRLALQKDDTNKQF